MNLNRKHIGISSLLLISVVLSACTPTPTPPPLPTVDVNAIYTQAAITMVADLTKNAPTITPTVPPTNTPAVIATLAPLPLAGPQGIPTLPPLATATSVAVATGDAATWLYQTPADGTSVKTGKVYNITWHLRNTGKTTWTTAYTYRKYTGNIATSANGYNLTSNVPPNGEVDITVVATASTTPGTYTTNWVLTNAQGVNFANFDLTINVVQGTTTSSGSEATATVAPNACSDVNYAWGGDTRNVDSGSPVSIDLQGGQVYITWGANTAGTGSFTVAYGGTNVIENQAVSTSGNKWFGSPDQESHNVTVTVSGAGSIIVSLRSINTNSNCY